MFNPDLEDIGKYFSGITREARHLLESSPRKYWSVFVVVFSVVLIIVLAVNLYIFASLGFGIKSVQESVSVGSLSTVDRNLLSEVVRIIEDRESTFSFLQTAVMPADPSL